MKRHNDSVVLSQTIEEYIPYLLGIMSCVSTGEIALKSEPGLLCVLPMSLSISIYESLCSL
jgi:hypothetical protein